jgi:hypothetical protein
MTALRRGSPPVADRYEHGEARKRESSSDGYVNVHREFFQMSSILNGVFATLAKMRVPTLSLFAIALLTAASGFAQFNPGPNPITGTVGQGGSLLSKTHRAPGNP